MGALMKEISMVWRGAAGKRRRDASSDSLSVRPRPDKPKTTTEQLPVSENPLQHSIQQQTQTEQAQRVPDSPIKKNIPEKLFGQTEGSPGETSAGRSGIEKTMPQADKNQQPSKQLQKPSELTREDSGAQSKNKSAETPSGKSSVVRPGVSAGGSTATDSTTDGTSNSGGRGLLGSLVKGIQPHKEKYLRTDSERADDAMRQLYGKTFQYRSDIQKKTVHAIFDKRNEFETILSIMKTGKGKTSAVFAPAIDYGPAGTTVLVVPTRARWLYYLGYFNSSTEEYSKILKWPPG
ncbi:hypothetical protein K440DRAFT_635893 [Wilcoxina mikolae CBS 423.85]|nr:hypothetical protein K440DRAFT_635893 [Wilcoxina mikolae CBS 423.85]